MNGVEGLILTVGIGLRLAVFFQGRPLWLDEALLAGNILGRSPGEMLSPLHNAQLSPLGFLWGAWTVTQLAGTGERALRFLPLVAGIVSLFVFARLTRRLLEPGAALLATALAALSPLLIYYSAEVKSYEFDWLCTVLVMLVTVAVIEDPSRRAWICWSLAALFGALFSTPAPFFIAASALALLVAAPAHRRLRGMLRVAAAGIPAAAIFALQLFTTYSSSRLTESMRQWWDATFLTPGLPGLTQGVDFAREFAMTVLFGVEPPRKVMTVVLAISVLGVISLGRRSPSWTVLVMTPTVLALIASLAHWWPLTARLFLFAVPAVILALASGVAAISKAAPRKAHSPLLVGLSLLQIGLMARGFPRSLELSAARFVALPDALRYVGARVGDSSTVYFSRDLSVACAYYHTWHPDRHELRGIPSETDCSLRGVRTVMGQWTTSMNFLTGSEADVSKTWQEFTDAEGRRILDRPTADLWVVIGPSRLQQTVPTWLEANGATRLAEQTMRGLRILQYRPR